MLDSKTCSRREALAATALGCMLLRAPSAQDSAQDPKTALRAAAVVFVRHAEKDMSGGPDPELTDRGRRRAEALSGMFGSAGVSALFATEFRRTQQTLQPLAGRLGCAVEGYAARDSREFARRLARRRAGELIVVAGHSDTLPVMVEALGGRLGELSDQGFLLDDEYDRVVLLHLAAVEREPLACLQTLDLRMEL